jgi:hypothetical protein
MIWKKKNCYGKVLCRGMNDVQPKFISRFLCILFFKFDESGSTRNSSIHRLFAFLFVCVIRTYVCSASSVAELFLNPPGGWNRIYRVRASALREPCVLIAPWGPPQDRRPEASPARGCVNPRGCWKRFWARNLGRTHEKRFSLVWLGVGESFFPDFLAPCQHCFRF